MTSYPPPPPPGQYPPSPPFAPQGYPVDPPRVAPPPPPGTSAVKAPPVAWLVPAAAVLAVIGAFLPWFQPEATGHGQTVHADNLHSWEDGKIGLLPPIVLTIVAISVISVLLGKAVRRFSSGADPVRSAAKYTLGAGVASAVCVVVAWFLITSQYKSGSTGWDTLESELKAQGFTLSRGPQSGYFLTIAAAAIAIIAGVLMLTTAKPIAAGPLPPPLYGPPPGVTPTQPPAAFQNQGFPAPPPGYPPPPPTSLEKPPPAS